MVTSSWPPPHCLRHHNQTLHFLKQKRVNDLLGNQWEWKSLDKLAPLINGYIRDCFRDMVDTEVKLYSQEGKAVPKENNDVVC